MDCWEEENDGCKRLIWSDISENLEELHLKQGSYTVHYHWRPGLRPGSCCGALPLNIVKDRLSEHVTFQRFSRFVPIPNLSRPKLLCGLLASVKSTDSHSTIQFCLKQYFSPKLVLFIKQWKFPGHVLDESRRKRQRKRHAEKVRVWKQSRKVVKKSVIPPCPPFTYLSDKMLLFNMPGNVLNGVSSLFQKGNNNFLSIFCLLVFLLPQEF